MDHLHHAHMAMALASVDPLAWVGFVSIFSFSFLASLHCALMCAPLVCALLGRSGTVSRRAVLLYNCGRLLSYLGMGALLGALGRALLLFSSPFGYVLATSIAAALFVAAWRTFHGQPGVPRFPRLQRITDPIARGLHRLSPMLLAFSLGLVTVVFPCMTLTPVLLLASASGSAMKGAALLTAFQAGTLTVMFIAPLMPAPLGRVKNGYVLRKISVLFLLTGGVATVFRLFHGR